MPTPAASSTAAASAVSCFRSTRPGTSSPSRKWDHAEYTASISHAGSIQSFLMMNFSGSSRNTKWGREAKGLGEVRFQIKVITPSTGGNQNTEGCGWPREGEAEQGSRNTYWAPVIKASRTSSESPDPSSAKSPKQVRSELDRSSAIWRPGWEEPQQLEADGNSPSHIP